MEKSESIANLTTAVIKVMEEVKNVEKNLLVGEENSKNSYKGVADKDVKKLVGQSMAKNGLTILPIKIEPKVTIERYVDQYNKPKQKVFTEVLCTYLLSHTSGEFITLQGYGHGDDSQDKSAGKATTYALKYALLYSFLVPTGNIDDSDNDHSENKEVPPVTPPQQAAPPQQPAAEKPYLNITNKDGKPLQPLHDDVKARIESGVSIDTIKQHYKLSKATEDYITKNFINNGK
jgi:hypothetical protein